MFWKTRRHPNPPALAAPETPVCAVCKGPATEYRSHEPWPGSTYAHTAWACKAHETYLDGHWWSSVDGTEHRDNGLLKSSCAYCEGEYGACGCPSQVVAHRFLAWDVRSVRGSLR